MVNTDLLNALVWIQGKTPSVTYEFQWEDDALLFLDIYEMLTKDYIFLGEDNIEGRLYADVKKSISFVQDLVKPFMTCHGPERRVKSPYFTRDDILRANEWLSISYKGQHFELEYNNTFMPGPIFRNMREKLYNIIFDW